MPEAPRWLADEMLGRLARYLRFLGFDTAYVQGLDDATVAEKARSEGRVLLTRDRRLAPQVEGAVLLRSTAVAGQLAELFRRFPGLPRTVRFERCTLCNGRLGPLPAEAEPDAAWPKGAARALAEGRPVQVCSICRQPYWIGSHASRLERDVQRWLTEVPS